MSRLCCAFAIALVATASISVTSASAEGAPVTLSARGVNFADRAQVKGFYDRVRAAARAACSSDSLTPWGSREDEACRTRFVSDAVNRVNAPLLTAMNNSGARKSSAYVFDDR